MFFFQRLPEIIHIYQEYLDNHLNAPQLNTPPLNTPPLNTPQLNTPQLKLSEFFQFMGLLCLFNPSIHNHITKSMEAFIWSYLFMILENFQTHPQPHQPPQSQQPQAHNTPSPQTQLSVWKNLRLKYYQSTLPILDNEWYWLWWGEQILKQYQYQYHPILTNLIEHHQI